MKFSVIICLIVTNFMHNVQCSGIMHKILKVNENASTDELKAAYLSLLKQWHEASTTLNNESELLHLKILHVYEVYTQLVTGGTVIISLSNAIIKLLCAVIPCEERELKSKLQSNFHDEHIITAEKYSSDISTIGIEVLHSISIPLTDYNLDLIKRSEKNVHLVLFYSVDSVNPRIIHSWFHLMEIFSPLGVVMVTIQIEKERNETLTTVFGDQPVNFPYLVLLAEGTSKPYKDDIFIDFLIIEFIRRGLPIDLVERVTDKTVDSFLSSWRHDNKVRALIYQPTLPVRLQYLMAAYTHRKNLRFGYVNMNDNETAAIRMKMNVTATNKDTFILLKEDEENPCAKFVMTSIPIIVLNEIILKNNFLILPRVSSQEMFDMICPIYVGPTKREFICIVFVVPSSLYIPIHDPKTSFRKFVEVYAEQFDNVSFMYVYADHQPELNAFTDVDTEKNYDNHPYIIALQRITETDFRYTLLMTDEYNWNSHDETMAKLRNTIENVVKNRESMLTRTVSLKEFFNDKTPGYCYRLYFYLKKVIRRVFINMYTTYLIIIITCVFFLTSFRTTYWRWIKNGLLAFKRAILGCKLERKTAPKMVKRLREALRPSAVFTTNGKCITTSRELRLHELKAETYNGMVRLLKPGCRTIVVLFDRERANLLVSQFYKAMWPYRKNRNLMFGYVNMEKKGSIEWYSELVSACLPDEQSIEINPYFCAGTVLSLSGMRKYFSIYHVKHPGFHNSDDNDVDDEPVPPRKSSFTDNDLLSGLSEWLDKLFDGSGSVIRYRVNHWPDFKIL